jgi:hypothetical protein
MKKFLVVLFGSIFAATLVSFVSGKDPWPVPEKYQKMANPVKSDAALRFMPW